MGKPTYDEVMKEEHYRCASDDEDWSGSDVEELDGSDCEFDEPAVSIWEDFSSKNIVEVWDHMKANHNLDYNLIKSKIPNFSDYHRILMVNALRSAFKNKDDKQMSITLAALEDPKSPLWNDQNLLQPVREDDRLLFEDPYGEDSESEEVAMQEARPGSAPSSQPIELSPEVEQKLQEVAALNLLPEQYKSIDQARQFFFTMSESEAIAHLDVLKRWALDPELKELKDNPDAANDSEITSEESSSEDEIGNVPLGMGGGPGAFKMGEDGEVVRRSGKGGGKKGGYNRA